MKIAAFLTGRQCYLSNERRILVIFENLDIFSRFVLESDTKLLSVASILLRARFRLKDGPGSSIRGAIIPLPISCTTRNGIKKRSVGVGQSEKRPSVCMTKSHRQQNILTATRTYPLYSRVIHAVGLRSSE